MVVMCIKTEAVVDDDNLKELQDTIMEKPENIYLIEEMAADSHVSPYHMIRKFKKAFGLTLHHSVGASQDGIFWRIFRQFEPRAHFLTAVLLRFTKNSRNAVKHRKIKLF